MFVTTSSESVATQNSVFSSASQPNCVAIEENYVATKDEVKRTKDWSRQRKVSLSLLLCFKWILENFMEFIYFSSFTI